MQHRGQGWLSAHGRLKRTHGTAIRPRQLLDPLSENVMMLRTLIRNELLHRASKCDNIAGCPGTNEI
jgi:hypothetical protein